MVTLAQALLCWKVEQESALLLAQGLGYSGRKHNTKMCTGLPGSRIWEEEGAAIYQEPNESEPVLLALSILGGEGGVCPRTTRLF